jgi:putative transposase
MSGTFTNHLYHIIYSTKNRDNLISEHFEEELYAYIGGIFKGEKGLLICAGGTECHIHLFGIIHPSISVSDMIKRIKGNSSAWINKNHKLSNHFAWQVGYGSFTVSESSKEKIINYIKNQKEHHRKRTFKDEYLDFLNKHNIEYDEKYIWN